MKSRIWVIASLLLMMGLMLQCQEDLDPSVAAVIADQEISVDEFRDFLKMDLRGKKPEEISLEDKKNSLNKLLDQRRRYLAAVDAGYASDSTYLKKLEQHTDILLARHHYNNLVRQTAALDTMLDRYLEWKKNRVQVAVVITGYKGAQIYSNERSEAAAKRLAERRKNKLAASDKPGERARELTDDKRNRPVMDDYPVGRYGTGVDSLIYAAKKGDIIGPVYSERGYLVFKVMDIQPAREPKNALLHKDEVRKMIYPYIGRKEQEDFDKYSLEFQEKYQYKFYEENAERFIKLLNDWGTSENRSLDNLPEELTALKLAEITGYQLTGQQFFDLQGAQVYRDWRKYSTKEDLRRGFAENILNRRAWAMASRDAGNLQDSTLQKAIKVFEYGELARMLERKMVDETINIDDTMIEAYYNANQAEFEAPQEVQLYQIPVKNRAIADMVKRMAEEGSDFRDLFLKYRTNRRENRFNLGFQSEKSQFQLLAKAGIEAGPNKIAGPVEYGKKTVVLKTGEIRPARIRPLTEVRNRVIAKIRQNQQNEKREQMLKKIRDQYSYQVNETALRSIS